MRTTGPVVLLPQLEQPGADPTGAPEPGRIEMKILVSYFLELNLEFFTEWWLISGSSRRKRYFSIRGRPCRHGKVVKI